VAQDVERTFPDHDYFRSHAVQDRMTNLLHVWTKLNGDIGYRQGMHELLGPIVWACEVDSLPTTSSGSPPHASTSSSSTEDLMYATLDSTYIEHDAWAIFQKVMASAKAWFDSSLTIPIPMSPQAGWIDPASQRFQVVQPIIALSSRIQSTLLAQVDPDLSSKLNELQIEPQMYCLRWLRVMFSRELPWEETLQLWDGIFAEDPTLRIVEWVCVALLLRIRDECA
jgi:TBC1 domain family protein 5